MAILASHREPGVVWALACRADELRFRDPAAALEVATAALEGQAALPRAVRRPHLIAFAWAVFGSCCRARAHFDEAEFALSRAASLVPPSDARGQADVALRFALLRADQRQGKEARNFIGAVVSFWRQLGGLELGKRLCTSGSIHIRLREYRQAAVDLEESLGILPPNGDRFHLSAVGNLAICHLEMSSSPAELKATRRLFVETARLVDPGSYEALLWQWIDARFLQRLGRLEESVKAMTVARTGIDSTSDGYDRALLLLDLTDLHLERGEAAAARQVALSSFGVMAALRNEPEALRAIQGLHRAAQSLSLDRAVVRSVRQIVADTRF